MHLNRHMGESRGLVVVVEDEPAIADVERLYLSQAGYGVHVERDGGRLVGPRDLLHHANQRLRSHPEPADVLRQDQANGVVLVAHFERAALVVVDHVVGWSDECGEFGGGGAAQLDVHLVAHIGDRGAVFEPPICSSAGRVDRYQPADQLNASLFRFFMVVAAIGTVFAAGYLLWLLQRVAFGTPDPEWDDVETLKSADGGDRFGRRFLKGQGCTPPYHAVKVTGALFHTQGGLAVDSSGRVKRRNGTRFPNLLAAGGAAAGVSGSAAAGYLSGNGLLTATTLGYLAGKAAAEQILS